MKENLDIIYFIQSDTGLLITVFFFHHWSLMSWAHNCFPIRGSILARRTANFAGPRGRKLDDSPALPNWVTVCSHPMFIPSYLAFFSPLWIWNYVKFATPGISVATLFLKKLNPCPCLPFSYFWAKFQENCNNEAYQIHLNKNIRIQ